MQLQLTMICMFALLLVDVVCGQDNLWIRTVDEQRIKATLESFDLDEGAILTVENATVVKVPASDLIWLWYPSRTVAVEDDSAILSLVNGDIFPGTIEGGDHSEIVLVHSTLGRLNIPLDQVATYCKPGQPSPPVEPLPIDRVTMGNGDSLAGTVGAVGHGVVTIETEIGLVDVPIDHILTMSLANSTKPLPTTPQSHLHLRDGTAVSLSKCRWQVDDAQIIGEVAVSPGKECKINADQIVRLSIAHGRALSLTLLKSQTILTQGQFDSELWAEWFSPVISNLPHARWSPFFSIISLHSHTLLRFQLPRNWNGGSLEFFARCDPHAPEWAQTNLVIRVEEKPVFSRSFGGSEGIANNQETPKLFKVEVPNVGSLDISAEFGPFGEPHGRLDIIEPLLIVH